MDFHALARIGNVIPLHKWSKKPAVAWREFQNRRATEEELTTWSRWPHANAAYITGSISGFIIIDLDGEAAIQRFYALGPLPPRTRTVITGRGLHKYFRLPAGVKITNSVGKLGPGIDVRGEGGFAVAEGSVHETGHVYVLEEPDAPVVDLPDHLLRLLIEKTFIIESPMALPATKAKFPKPPAGDGEGRERIYAHAALEGEAEALANTPAGRRNDALNVAAIKLGGFIKSGLLSEIEVTDRLFRASVANGLMADDGERAVMLTIASGIGAATARVVPERKGNGHDHTPPDEIDLSILRDGQLPAPDLPIDVFGPWAGVIRDIADACAAQPDYVAMSLLAAAGSVLGNSRWPSAWGAFREPPVLYVALVGDPSSGKSPATDLILGALRTIEDQERQDFEPVLVQWEEEAHVARANEKLWFQSVKDALKEGEEAPAKPKDATVPAEPQPPRCLIGDSTPEKMLDIIAGNPRGLLLHFDELSQFFENMTRYRSGTSRGLYIAAYGGRAYGVDTVSRGSIRIPNLSLGIVGSLQPDKVARHFVRADDDGLAARFLYTWPKPRAFSAPKPQATAGAYVLAALKRLRRLFMLKGDFGPQPTFAALEPQAEADFEKWCKAQRLPLAGSSLFRNWTGKARGHVLRLAGVLEYLAWAIDPKDGEPTTIDSATLASAIRLYDTYLKPMAERTFGDAMLPIGERHGAALARWIVRERVEGINASAVRRARVGGMTTAAEVGKAIQALVEAGVLVPAFSREGNPGRPKLDYAVNPKLWEAVDRLSSD